MKQFIGKENFAGFKYGINLNSIKRTINSDQITTKMIVKNNANEFAPNGSCSISRASLNPSKTNTVYNFDYYINQDLLDANSTQLALYEFYEATRENAEEVTAL
jgi:phage minor structural protein